MGTDYTNGENGQAPLLQGVGAMSLSQPDIKHLPFYSMKVEIQSFVKKLAEVYHVDIDTCTSSIYAAVAAIMGNKFTTYDGTYTNTLALWLCHVAISGYGKTPVESAVMAPFNSYQKRFRQEFKERIKDWEKSKEGAKPKCKKAYIQDTTPEALYQGLEDNEDGLLLYREELAGWVQDFGRYNQSGEISTLLSIWSGAAIDTSRLTREGNWVEHPFLTVFGGTQPDLLAKNFGRDGFISSGFNARFLWVYPEITISLERYKGGFPKEYAEEWHNFLDKLYSLEPRQVTFSVEAIKLYDDYWKSMQIKKINSDSYMSQVYSKLQIYCQKWAGLTFLLSEDNYQADYALAEVDALSMQIAIESMQLFEEWAAKVYAKMCESSPSLHLTKADLIRKFSEVYPIQEGKIQQFADSIGVSRPLISRALNKNNDKTDADVTP